MRITSHASEQYRRQSALAQKPCEKKQTEPQAKVTTRSFGFRMGRFGLDFESSSTVIDPSLTHDVQERQRQARSFRVETEVKNLRATIGADGATYRDSATASGRSGPSIMMVRTAMAAYPRNSEDILPMPGNMLASVI